MAPSRAGAVHVAVALLAVVATVVVAVAGGGGGRKMASHGEVRDIPARLCLPFILPLSPCGAAAAACVS
jgi:hypothetical protein